MPRLKLLAAVLITALLINTSMAIGSAWIGSGDIINGGVRENDIGKMAVTKTKIKTGAVNKYKLASGSVNTYKILDETIQGRDIANGTIRNTDIASNAAISESKIQFATRTKHLSIAATAFTPTNSDDRFATTGNSLYPVYSGGQGTSYFHAPVHLPDGAVVTKLRYRAKDSDSAQAAFNTYARLKRRVMTDGYYSDNEQTMANASSSGASSLWQNLDDNMILWPQIDNSSNSYFVEINFLGRSGTWQEAGGVIITYQVSSP